MANLRVDKITSTETFETTGSVQFDGSGDYLDVTESNNDFDFDGDFTIETWICFNGITSNNWTDFLGSANNSAYLGSSKSGWIAAYYTLDVTGLQFRLSYQNNSAWEFELGWDYTANTGNWYHVAYTRKGGVIDCYINGVKLARSTTVGTVGEGATITSSEGFVRVGGGHGSTSKLLNGHLSNTRILKGKALYTSNFKPPMRELEVIPGTVVLACQSKTDASLEKTGKTITVNGNAVANELTPGILTPIVKSGGGSAITGSVEFDGNYDGLVLSKSSDFAFGTGDFTIEGWFNVSDTGAIRTLFDSRNTDNNSTGIFIGINSDDNLYTYGFPSGTGVTNYGIPKHGEWHHFAVVRNGSSGLVFLNGIKISGSINTGSTNYTDQGASIGQPSTIFAATLYRYKGFISNLRVVKGTALYTDDFIPPTRELKKVPGTVLLCCQDPDSPLTEATGKTITPYGNLGDGSLGQELVTNNDVWTLTCGGTSCTNWSVSKQGRSLAGTTVASGNIRATYTLPKGDYLVSLRWTGGAFAVQDSTGYIVATNGTDTEFSSSEDGAYSFYMTDTTSVVITGSSWSTAYTVDDISIKRIYRNNGASNFTPQVGDDRKVTLEGVTKINSDAYFYLPTGDTESREATGSYNAGTRGLFTGGYDQPALTDTIDYITISSTGNFVDFGNLTDARILPGALASSVRGIIGGGTDPSASNIIDYVTILSTGNANDFGDLTVKRRAMASFSNDVRGIWAGGDNPSRQDTIDYVTISSRGDAVAFGSLGEATNTLHGTSSPTRGLLMGGETGSVSPHNAISYVTISTTGSNKDFGDLTQARRGCSSCSSPIRALTGGGNTGSVTNTIDFVTIATTGNAFDFGDLTQARWLTAATSNSIRGVWGGGYNPSPAAEYDIIDYITIASTGNATDFGNLQTSKRSPGACSNGHGGLG